MGVAGEQPSPRRPSHGGGSWSSGGGTEERGTSHLPPGVRGLLRDACADAPVVHSPDGERRLVAINAWNEWGESMVLEPSQEHGDAMLRAMRRVLG